MIDCACCELGFPNLELNNKERVVEDDNGVDPFTDTGNGKLQVDFAASRVGPQRLFEHPDLFKPRVSLRGFE